MKALLSGGSGGPEALVMGELPDPVAGVGQVLIAVKSCAVSYPDVLMISDRYQSSPPRPFAPGGELSGIVEAVGEGVTEFTPGDRVIGVCGHGGLAEKAVLAANAVCKLPANRGFDEGAALPLTYATSLHGLDDRARLKQGETLLVLGAAGGVGLAAVELGVAFGARVIGAVSSEEKAEAVRAAGADAALVYGTGPLDADGAKALAARFKAALGPGGADVVFDPVGGDYAEPALRAIAWEGRYLVVGFPAGIPRLPLNLVLLKGCNLCGVYWGAFAAREPAAKAANFARLLRLWQDGRITPRITEIFPLVQGGTAIARLADRAAIGKLVVKIAD